MSTTASSAPTIAYLGPEGTFTHAAALTWQGVGVPRPSPSVVEVYRDVAEGRADYGVVAIESSVEGYVVPSLDAILASSEVVAVDECTVDIVFDAFMLPDAAASAATEVTAHPHGLAQCVGFATEHALTPVPAASNAAACRDVHAHQVALGPRICGELYGLAAVARSVQDFDGARTRFLLLTMRNAAHERIAQGRGPSPSGAGLSDARLSEAAGWRTMLAITPHERGAGVLARITQAFGERGVNMSSLITRPVKAQEGTYIFVVTLDGAPWKPDVRALFDQLLADGDSLKTLGVFPRRTGSDVSVDSSMVPAGSVRSTSPAPDVARGLLW